MRLTIERLRTLVLSAGILLIVALIAFLAIAHFRNRFNVREIPKRLGADIKQEANEIIYTQAHNGHTLFKIRASKEIQLKKSGRVILNNVHIEIYGPDGGLVDRISGGQFEYDQKAGKAMASGPVEIMMARPTASLRGQQAHGKAPLALQDVAKAVEAGAIEVKTSGLTFDQKSGTASTAQQVQFTTVQGSGSAVGALFDSDAGKLVLDHAVELNIRRGPESVQLRAAHAEFERISLICRMQQAEADDRSGHTTAGSAQILFRPDGSAIKLDASDGFTLANSAGSRVSAPSGTLEFNEKNQPQRGRLQGGVVMEADGEGRQMHGSAPSAQLIFDQRGELHRVHLENGVTMHSEEERPDGRKSSRDWQSSAADLDFRKDAAGRMSLTHVHGTGGVLVRASNQRGAGPTSRSDMRADDLTAQLGPEQELQQIAGAGHATLEQTTAAGVLQKIEGDRVRAIFGRVAKTPSGRPSPSGTEVERAIVDGHVVLTQDSPAKPGKVAPAPLRATANQAVYEGAGGSVELAGQPRIQQGGLDLTADRVEMSQASGEAFAKGHVKGSWLDAESSAAATQASFNLGQQGPVHVVAEAAKLTRSPEQVVFSGKARLWQQANSIAAPIITLDRQRQTLVAQGADAGQPVHLVLVSGGAPGASKEAATVVSVRAGNLKYSAAERKAILGGGVSAQTADVTSSSDTLELVLLPAGVHGGQGAAGQVDRMTARGHVRVNSQGREGTGRQLVFSGETGDYVLTGTPGDPPKLTDPAHGTVSGEALIFNGRNDSVRIEGDGRSTRTETIAPR